MATYDVIIVGAGFSGLICANYLAKEGKKTALVEQSYHAGGNMSGFKRKGFYFDGGDQSFESLGIVFPILQDLGVYDEFDWVRIRYRMMSKDFDFFVDSTATVENALLEAFPEESGLRSVFDEVRRVERFLENNYDPHHFPLINAFSLKHLLKASKWLPQLMKWVKHGYRVKVCDNIKNPHLRNWLTNIGYYKMPFIFFAGFWHIWAHDYWYPAGGMQALIDKLVEKYQSHGGDLFFNTSVKRIDIKDNRAAGITTEDGEYYSGDTIVYAGDYKKFVGGLIGENHFKPDFVKKVRNSKLTEAIVSVYLGLDVGPEKLENQFNANHLFYFPNYDVIFPDMTSDENVHKNMWVVLTYFGFHNKVVEPEGKSTAVLQTYSAYDWQKYWKNNTDDVMRTKEYINFKNTIGDQLIENAHKIYPDLRNRIVYREVGTPLSLIRFSRNSVGSTGGWCYHEKESVVWRWGLNMFRAPVEDLYTAGHYTLWPGGVISAALSGRMVANLVLGRRMLSPMEHTSA